MCREKQDTPGQFSRKDRFWQWCYMNAPVLGFIALCAVLMGLGLYFGMVTTWR
jgi:hypothetical protein